MKESQSPAPVEQSYQEDEVVERQRWLSDDQLPWLYFAITRPVGTPTGMITATLKQELKYANYHIKEIDLSKVIEETIARVRPGTDLVRPTKPESPNDRIERLMKSGDILRDVFGPDIVAKLAIQKISETRRSDLLEANTLDPPLNGVAYVISSLLHPREVQAFRQTYKSRFFLIGVNSPRLKRTAALAQRLSKPLARGQSTPEGRRAAENLAQIDAGLKAVMPAVQRESRLNVDSTFHQADIFCNVDVQVGGKDLPPSSWHQRAPALITKLVHQIFGDPFGTPTDAEWSMRVAFSAALSSVSMGRSVGAAVFGSDGALISTGCNEVAKPGGGRYRQEDNPDWRDHQIGHDPSDGLRLNAIEDFLSILFDNDGWISEVKATVTGESLDWLTNFEAGKAHIGRPPAEIVRALPQVEDFADTRILNIIEFGRSVHAEMAAVTDAVRRGVAIQDATVYVTTFPCHECTRNLISSGIRTILYIEPYGKSLSPTLYPTEIRIFGESYLTSDLTPPDAMVEFIPFDGIAPRRIDDLYQAVARKSGLRDEQKSADDDKTNLSRPGARRDWHPSSGRMRSSILGYSVTDHVGNIVPEIELAMLGIERMVATNTANLINKVEKKQRK